MAKRGVDKSPQEIADQLVETYKRLAACQHSYRDGRCARCQVPEPRGVFHGWR